MESKMFSLKVAGYSPSQLTVSTGIAKCGHIKDGISLVHGNQGSWVMAFSDLEKVYLAAKEFRDQVC
jgi:hypothetical protein